MTEPLPEWVESETEPDHWTKEVPTDYQLVVYPAETAGYNWEASTWINGEWVLQASGSAANISDAKSQARDSLTSTYGA